MIQIQEQLEAETSALRHVQKEMSKLIHLLENYANNDFLNIANNLRYKYEAHIQSSNQITFNILERQQKIFVEIERLWKILYRVKKEQNII